MTSRRLMLACALAASLGAGTACRQDMHDAPRYDTLEKSDFFPDRRASRALIEGTVARGQLRADDAYYTGKENGQPIAVAAGGHHARQGAARTRPEPLQRLLRAVSLADR